MNPDDQEKTSFVTGQGTYYYRVMPFGLKNAGATYQRLVNRMFQKQIGTSMEVYIDDMLVKSTTAELHIAHLSEAFQILREYNMKLNPAKCAFGVLAVTPQNRGSVDYPSTCEKSIRLVLRDPYLSKNGHLGPCINTHQTYTQLYSNSPRVISLLLIQIHIKIYNSNTYYPKHQSHNSTFFKIGL